MFRSIRWTLQLWHAAILFVALGSFATALYLDVSRGEFRATDAELESAARVLAVGPGGPPPQFRRFEGMPTASTQPGVAPGTQPTTLPFWLGSLARREREREREEHERNGPPRDWWSRVPQDALRRVGQDSRDQPYFVVWDAGGSVIRSSSPAPDVPIAEPFTASTQPVSLAAARFRDRGPLREVIVAGPFGSRVLVGKSMRREIADVAHLRWTLLAAGAAVLTVGLFGGWLLSGRAIRPIRLISDTARSISGSDLSRRIAIEDTQSELGSLARTLNETFDRLESAFARQSRFTADASHELRTPLSVVLSHAELALSRERTAPEYRHSLDVCLRAARRMKSLVESLMTLARADAGQLAVHRDRFNLCDVVDESVSMVASQAEEKKVAIQCNVQAVSIEADRTGITQLTVNLLTNAVRYNREGGKVSLSLTREGSDAVLTVADTGAGIAMADQPHVFERFFRADKARTREVGGSGLGLAICQGIVEAHRGKISFASTPGEGTTFVVRLPLTASEIPLAVASLSPPALVAADRAATLRSPAVPLQSGM